MSHEIEALRLVFSPRAWLKWQFFCHAGPTEVGLFGLSRENNLLTIEDLLVVRQRTSVVSVVFDDTAVANLFDEMTDMGIPPQRYARIWLHTHPGASVTPSGVDEATFRRVFGACDWSVMGILGRTGRTSARLQFSAGPGGSVEIPCSVDWSAWPVLATAANPTFDELILGWEQDYCDLIEPETFPLKTPDPQEVYSFRGLDDLFYPEVTTERLLHGFE